MSAARDRFADAVDDALDGAAQGALSSARREILAAHDAAVAEATRELWEALNTIATGDWSALPDSMGLSCEFGEDARYNHPAREKAVRKYAAARAVLAGGE